ncbi:hypothetical protein ABZ749_01155 [Micromonospora sp. NPDC047753]|uniref:hypothetical protein n=1 Tax=Micromonospora sp. NPDC047753 TaxID=3154817 RepID=UPI0033F28EE1
METLHPVTGPGRRGGFPAAGCKRFEPSTVIEMFPGAGTTPAPAGPPAHTLDLDAVADRWTDLLDARERGDHTSVRFLEAALAEDVPLLREEIHRLTVALRTATHG